MKYVLIIIQVAALYAIYKLGTLIQGFLGISIPGSIIGMLLLFLLLVTKLVKENWLKGGSEALLAHLPLLFIPPTVGIVAYTSLFKGVSGWLSIIIVVVSTASVMVISSAVGQVLAKVKAKQTNKNHGMEA